VWHCPADFAEGEAVPELLAIRFANSENAGKFKDAFEDAKTKNADLMGVAVVASKDVESDGSCSSSDSDSDDDKKPAPANETPADDKPAAEEKAQEKQETKQE